jgi:hypothetical protein
MSAKSIQIISKHGVLEVAGTGRERGKERKEGENEDETMSDTRQRASYSLTHNERAKRELDSVDR